MSRADATPRATTVEIRRVQVPAGLGTEASRDFERYADASNAFEAAEWQHDDFVETAAELLPHYRNERYFARSAFLAVEEDDVVGVGFVRVDRSPDAEGSIVYVAVRDDRRSAGIGSRLLAELERVAIEAGRPVLTSFSPLPLARAEAIAGARLRSSAGDDVVPAEWAPARFALRHGYALGQVERLSRLDLFDAALEPPTVAPGYRLTTWMTRTPDELVDAYAAARVHMATEVPAADLEIDEEIWDAERVREYERERIEGNVTLLVAAAIAEDGSIAAYTELELPPGQRAVFQNDTLVLRAHRGRRLGMAVKLANLAMLRDVAPERRRVYTWNADENEHMLAINTALGFEMQGYEAAWQRRVR